MSKKQKGNELLRLKNVGPATCEDFECLDIDSIEKLAKASADELYLRLQRVTGRSHDPCVWDVFASAIHEARTGERQVWWLWTKTRKKRQAAGTFCVVEKNKA